MFRAVAHGWNKFWRGAGLYPDRTNKVEDVYLRFYNGTTFGEYVDVRLDKAADLLRIQGFDPARPTVLYIHGFIETALQESVEVVISAYLQGRPATNLLLLDWSNMAHGSYLINAAPNTKKVGVAAAEHLRRLVEAGVRAERLHVVGHSLGGHVAGYVARELRHKHGHTVGRVTALDPAFPAFYPGGVVMEHVGAADAAFVDVIHTDAGGYGAPVCTGTADFWPNAGKATQPGCPRFAPIPLSDNNLCSHWRSWRFYAESVLRPDAFPASPADSYQKFRSSSAPERGLVYMGVDVDTSATGSYYLVTNAQSPFGRGMAGLYAKGEKSTSPVRLDRVEDVFLRVYNGTTVSEYMELRLENAEHLLQVVGFNQSCHTVLYAHGFLDAANSDSVMVVESAYVKYRADTGLCINVVLIDWSNMGSAPYLLNAAPNTAKVGKAAADHLCQGILDGGDLHLVGHSLGAHMLSDMATTCRDDYGQIVARITGLDPAGPGFYPGVLQHLSPSDADFVDVVHTDAGGYGAAVSTGTVDFWPNCGKAPQPGCPVTVPVIAPLDPCNHWRSFRFYAESVLRPYGFPASPADSCPPDGSSSAPESQIVYTGEHVNTSATGDYYLFTDSQPPYGRGTAGLQAGNSSAN